MGSLLSMLLLFPLSASAAEENLADLVVKFNKEHTTETKVVNEAIHRGTDVDEKLITPAYKELLYKLYLGYTGRALQSDSISRINSKETSLTQFLKKALEKLEHREKEVDARSDLVRNHLVVLESKQFRFKFRTFLEFLSWQSQATLVGPFESTGLLTTNIGFCPGVALNYENRFWAISTDLCGLYGAGGVSAIQGLVEYQQSNVPAYGGKWSLGIGKVVASSGSEFGVRGNLLYVRQTLTTPPNPQYSVDQNKTLGGSITLFSRWRFQRLYFQTDFGRMVGRPATVWSLGIGAVY
jgi:hypothetical protein